MVKSAWEQTGPGATDLSSFYFKQRLIKEALRKLNRENFSDIQKRVVSTNNLLSDVQELALQNPTPMLFQQQKDLQEKWNFLRRIEEAYFRQKSRIFWLQNGDHNIAYFHRVCVTRAAFNSIKSFTIHPGIVITDPATMSNLAVSHFQAILAPVSMPPIIISSVSLQSLLSYRCSQMQKQTLSSLSPPEIIQKAVLALNPNKSPGPDEYTPAFYKSSWSIIGKEVVTAIEKFFASAFLPTSTNSTILAMVPKKPGETYLADYMPISCCNTLYKAISKLLVPKLKPILPDFILPNQTSFVQGRLLLENTILVADLLNGYNEEKGPERIAIKVDIAKAFDTIRWEFIMAVLRSIEVPEIYLRWLQACITTPTFTVGFNGTVQGFFRGKRGVRQGDPLSLYLFVIAMNILSIMLDKAANVGQIDYHFNCEKSKLTHL